MQNKINISPVLEIRNVSKEFSGVYALKNVDMEIFPGQVTAAIGENGAGKSTLMKIISGVYSDFEGEIFYRGEKVSFKNPKEAAEKGIVIIHQELNLIPHMSITENLFLGQELTTKFGMLDYPKMHEKAAKLLARLQLDVNPGTAVNRLRVGQQQLVEIARALLVDSKVLIMDEPTSAISDHEIKLLFRIIKELKKQNVAIVYISHKLNELFEIADRFEVLRDGEHVGSGLMEKTTQDQLIGLMVGRKIKNRLSDNEENLNDEILRVENLSFRNPENKANFLVTDVSFTLRIGEVLGIAGLMGAGRSELLEAIFGLHPQLVSGSVYIDNEKVRLRNVSDAIAAGIALVPEDRKLQGLILNMDVTKNTSLASLKDLSSFGFINNNKEVQLGKKYIQELNTNVPSVNIEVEKLSGGNQQKVVLAKWLATNPKILLLDEPTRGIDVGAKAEIYKLIKKLAELGMGIVVVSSELPEILAVSDTVLVMSESKVTAIYTREEASEEKIMRAAIAEKE
jgi:ribose transport system ATP-binding protein